MIELMKSSKEESENKRMLCMELLKDDGLTLLKVNGEIPICSPDLTFKCLPVSS